MPVEIKELVIRMVAAQPTNANTPQSGNAAATPVEQDAVVAACVKEVLKILEKKQKR